jgi:uncharacterized protein (TIGR02145 family)
MKKVHLFLIFSTIAMAILFTACTDEPNATGTVTDKDGNVYHTVTIGTQTWMVENLKTTKYNDGTSIPNVIDNTAWAALTTPAYCWYNNDAATYKDTYGALYNWYAVNTGKLAPAGWHVATDAEWTTLEDYVDANRGISGSIAKALAATTNWATSTVGSSIGNDLSKNNSTGFAGLPGGCRSDISGSCFLIGNWGFWWSSTEFYAFAKNNRMYYDDNNMGAGNDDKQCGYSVRCIKD